MTQFTHRAIFSAQAENNRFKNQAADARLLNLTGYSVTQKINDPRFVDGQLTLANG